MAELKDSSRFLNSLFSAVRNLAADDGFKDAADIFDEIANLRSENTRLSSSFHDAYEQYRHFRNELETREAKLEEQKAVLESTVQTKDGEIEELLAHKSRLEGDVQERDDTIQQDRADHEAKIAAKDEDISALNDEKAGLQGDVERVTTELEVERKASAEKVEEIARLHGDVERVTSELDSEKTISADKSEQIAGLEGDVRAVTSELDAEKEVTAAKSEEIAGLQGDVERLNTELDGEKGASAEKSEQIASLQGDVERLTGELNDEKRLSAERAEEIAALQQTIEGKDSELESLREQLETTKAEIESTKAMLDDLEQRLADIQDQLEGRELRVAELERYRVELRHEPEDKCIAKLDVVWTSILSLVETHFKQDLDAAVLADPSCWTNLRGSDHLKAAPLQIPLPASNSAAAKQMRAATVLAALSRSLHKHVFRPVYLVDDPAADADLVRFLRELDGDSPSSAANCRSILLAALPAHQKRSARRREQAVVREVSWLVQHLLSALQFESFCAALEQVVHVAVKTWMTLQGTEIMIEPYFGPPYDEFEWQVLPLLEVEDGDDGVVLTNGHANGHLKNGVAVDDDEKEDKEEGDKADPDVTVVADAENADADEEKKDEEDDEATIGNNHLNGDESKHAEDDEDDEDQDDDGAVAVMDPRDILLVVWPSMCAVEGGELESIAQGFVVTKEQAQAAFDEIRSRQPTRPHSRRARTLSFAGPSRMNSPGRSFLSSEDGAALNDG